jgi:hypothetical protein
MDSIPFDAKYDVPEVDLAALLLEDHASEDDEGGVAVIIATI